MNSESHVAHLLAEDAALKRSQLLSKVTQLTIDQLQSCEAFWLGNDPIKQEDFTSHKANNPFVFVGTSMFGAISLSCHLGKDVSCVPQVIIVDLSAQVATSWNLVKTYFSTCTECDPKAFVAGFIEFLKKNNIDQFSMDIFDERSFIELQDLLVNLITEYGFTRFKQMINEAVILKQSWGHSETFQHIRDVYKDADIYAYPSNIIHCISDYKTQKEVAHCVETLQPVLSIQTNLDSGEPTKFHLIQNNTVSSIMRTLGPGPFLHGVEREKFDSEITPNMSAFFYHKPGDKETTPLIKSTLEI